MEILIENCAAGKNFHENWSLRWKCEISEPCTPHAYALDWQCHCNLHERKKQREHIPVEGIAFAPSRARRECTCIGFALRARFRKAEAAAISVSSSVEKTRLYHSHSLLTSCGVESQMTQGGRHWASPRQCARYTWTDHIYTIILYLYYTISIV